MKWKKPTVITILLLLFFQKSAYGAPSSALDIFDIIYRLEPGTNVEVAYDMLGSPHERIERMLTMPPALRWDIKPYGTYILYLRDSFTIHTSTYHEIYDQMEPALQRYKELKEGFHEILDVAGVPFREFDHTTGWLIGNFFGVKYEKLSFLLGSKHRVGIFFVPRKE